MNIKVASIVALTMVAFNAMALPKALVWDKLSLNEFKEARDLAKGTVLLPFGCVEKHGRHLPLGTDSLVGMYLCEKASEIEPVLVYNIGNLGAVWESKHWLGTVAISHNTLTAVLDDLCNEFARNGCTNVVIVNCHGGNSGFLQSFVRSRLEKPRTYNVYYHEDKFSNKNYAEWRRRFGEVPTYGHACIYETSLMLYAFPELVHMDKINVEESMPKYRQRDMSKARLFTPIDWYAECDTQSYGDPSKATKEMGEFFMDIHITNLVNAVRMVKNDSLMPALRAEFDKHCANPQY
ncbi:MAG: creatininase family protein [Kiritimatiellae bacterium]|nr:creatininase family protein [Kiritimatiellia bacterium]